MKRCLHILLALLLCIVPMTLTASASPFYEISWNITAVDDKRGADETIIYTPAYGSTTQTNAYGYEIVVDKNGMVLSVGGNNQSIPKDGFVISGHGSSSDWLRENIVLGMRAEFDKDNSTVLFSYSADSVKAAVDAAFDRTVNAIENAKANYIYVDHAVTAQTLSAIRADMDTAVTAYQNGGDDVAFESACQTTLNALSALQNSLCDSYPVQYRGVWIRPSQRTAAEVKLYVQKLAKAGINTVSIEGCYANSVIMNVPKDSLFEKNPAFKYDVLQAYIDACHEYGLECHLWMPVMKVGNDYDGDPSRNVLAKKPEWASLNQKGTAYNESGFIMVDPANKEARAYLVDFYKYIVETYDIDCLELDYIRYYVTSEEYDYGYTQAAFEGFEDTYHYGVTPAYDRHAFYWDEWVQYRCDCVTAMVQEIHDMLKDIKSDVLLSADVAFPAASARNNSYQEFETWLDEELLDILHPMAYGDGFTDEIRRVVQKAGNKCMVVTGLGSQWESLGAVEMERQAIADNDCGAYGDFYFEAGAYLRDNTYDLLSQSVYRNKAIPPFAYGSGSIRTTLDYMQGRIDDILLPLGGITDKEAAALTQSIAALRETVHGSDFGPAELDALHKVIDTVKNGTARNVLTADLYRAEQIACVVHDLSRSQLVVEKTPILVSPASPLIILLDIVLVAIAVIGSAVVMLKQSKTKEGVTDDD